MPACAPAVNGAGPGPAAFVSSGAGPEVGPVIVMAVEEELGAVELAVDVIGAGNVCTSSAFPIAAAGSENTAVAVLQHRVFSPADSQQ
jgi:hypothetical protein